MALMNRGEIKSTAMPPPYILYTASICGPPGPGMPFRITSRAGLLPPGPCQTPEMHIEPWMNHGPDEPW